MAAPHARNRMAAPRSPEADWATGGLMNTRNMTFGFAAAGWRPRLPMASWFGRGRSWWIWGFAAAYLLAAHLALATAILKSDFLQRIDRNVVRFLPRAEFDSVYRRWAWALAGSDRAARPGALLFVGDSIMRDLDTGSIARHTLNLAIPGETSARALQRLSGYRSLATARGLVLGVGINDLSFRSAGETLDIHAEILERVPRATPVMILGLLPIDARIRGHEENAYVAAVNDGLRDLCARRFGCHFLDLAARFMDETGGLAPSAHRGDGQHLSAVGREIYWAAVYDAVRQVMPPARVRAPDGEISDG